MPSVAERSKRDRYLQYWGALKLERSTFDAHWAELSRWVRPRRERFFVSDRNKGDRRNQQIIDSTANYALRTLASGLHAGLTSPARPWFVLTTPDPELATFGPVQEWLHEVTLRMMAVMVRSNLYNTFSTLYGDYGLFGTPAMGLFADSETVMRAASYPIGSYAGSVDGRGRLLSFAREFELTVEALVEEFGGPDGEPLEVGKDPDWSRFSMSVQDAWRRGDGQTPVTVLQIIQRQRRYDQGALDGRQWPYTSCYLEVGRTHEDVAGNRFLREKGYRSMPVMMPRWEVTAEDVYATDCPGMTVLGDVKQLQSMTKEKAKAVQKMVSPPVTAPSHVRSQAVSLLPADITYADIREGQQGIKPIHEVRLPIGELRADIADIRYLIKQGFYEPLFLMISSSDPSRGSADITAREIDERHEEKLIALGPVLERTNDELLDPVIDRTYQLMDEAGLIPPPPEDLQGVSLGVEYVSLLAQAQKLAGIVAVDRFVRSVGPVIGVAPEVRHKVDWLAVTNEYGTALGVNPKILRSDDEARQMASAEAQAQQRAQQAAEAQAASQTVKNLGDTDLETDSALRRLVGAVSA